MKLTDIFLALEAGELSTQTSLIDTVTGVKPENYNKVISHINLGLTNLYERFNIRTGDVWVMMLEGVAEYTLDYKHAFTNLASTELKYIVDSPYDIFGNDVIRILEATTEIGEPLPINDRTKEKSIFTPSQNTIQIPWKVGGDAINVVYRAAHRQIRLADYNDITEIEVELPASYLEPLLYFVAYRHFAGIGGQSATPTSLGYFQKYDARCNQILLNGVPNIDQSVSTDFFNNGWA